MSETRVTSVSAEFQNIAKTIQKYSFAAIDAYKNNQPVDALPSLFALKAFANGLPTPFDLAIELIDILANPNRKTEELATNFLSLATAIIDFHQKNKDSDKLIPHAISLQVLVEALATRLNADQKADLLTRLNELVIMDQSGLDSPFDTLLYPARVALNMQGLATPSVYKPASELSEPSTQCAVLDMARVITSLDELFEDLNQYEKKMKGYVDRMDPKTKEDDRRVLNTSFTNSKNDNYILREQLNKIRWLFEEKLGRKGKRLNGFNPQGDDAYRTFVWLTFSAVCSGEGESRRAHAWYCLRGIIYFLFPQASTYQAVVPGILPGVNPVVWILWNTLSILCEQKQFGLAGELLQDFGEKEKYCRLAWALSPGSDFIKSLFEGLKRNDDEQAVLLALQFINIVAQNENILPAKAERLIQGLLKIPEDQQWKILDFKPKSYAVAAAFAPFLEGCAHEAILRENDAPLVARVVRKVKPLSLEDKPWLTLRRGSFGATGTGMAGAVIVAALLLALPSTVLSFWLNPLLWIGFACLGLSIMGGLAYSYDSVFGSHSQALPQNKQDEIVNAEQLVEAYEQKHEFVFGFVQDDWAFIRPGFFSQEAVAYAHNNIKYNVTALLKAQGLNPTNALEVFGADGVLAPYGHYYPTLKCRYVQLLSHVRPENDMALFKPLFSSTSDFNRVMELFSNLHSVLSNLLLPDFLLYEMQQLEKKPDFSLEEYQKTAIHDFLDGPFQLFIGNTRGNHREVTPFIRNLIKEIARRPICIMQLLRQQTTSIFHLEYVLEHAKDDKRNAILNVFFLTEDDIKDFPNEATKVLSQDAIRNDLFFAESFRYTRNVSRFATWLGENLSRYREWMQEMVNATRFWKLLEKEEFPRSSRDKPLSFNEKLKNLCFLDPTDMLKKLFINEYGRVNYARMQGYIQQDATLQEDRKLKEILPEYRTLFEILTALESGNFSEEVLERAKGSLENLGDAYQYTIKILQAVVEYKQTVDKNSDELKKFREFLQERSMIALDVIEQQLKALEVDGLLSGVKLKQRLDGSKSAEYLESCKKKDVSKGSGTVPIMFSQGDGNNDSGNTDKIIVQVELEVDTSKIEPK